jgi:uncharacterized membrane protein YtjA (UPF0391 family)
MAESGISPLKRAGMIRAERDSESSIKKEEEVYMLGWTLIFLIIALIAGVLGFTGIAGAAVGIARVLFAIFLILFLATLILRLVNG